MKITWTKDDMRDSRGYPMTQALFLETLYDVDKAIWTFKDESLEFKGKIFPSLRQYYLEIADPTEYQFAKQCTLGWDHWKRMLENKQIRVEVDKWREELEISLRSEGIQAIIDATATEGGNFQAAKWLADKGWSKQAVGRPSKSDKERDKRIADRVNEGFGAEILRMKDFT